MKVENFSINLKRVRLGRGMTQKQFAEMVGISQQSYQKYESGYLSPTLRTVRKFMKALGISIEELFR